MHRCAFGRIWAEGRGIVEGMHRQFLSVDSPRIRHDHLGCWGAYDELNASKSATSDIVCADKGGMYGPAKNRQCNALVDPGQ
jgi:hypothetical protein